MKIFNEINQVGVQEWLSSVAEADSDKSLFYRLDNVFQFVYGEVLAGGKSLIKFRIRMPAGRASQLAKRARIYL
jgi:hypothetical protein